MRDDGADERVAGAGADENTRRTLAAGRGADFRAGLVMWVSMKRTKCGEKGAREQSGLEPGEHLNTARDLITN